jgi:hypothetical protein
VPRSRTIAVQTSTVRHAHATIDADAACRRSVRTFACKITPVAADVPSGLCKRLAETSTAGASSCGFSLHQPQESGQSSIGAKPLGRSLERFKRLRGSQDMLDRIVCLRQGATSWLSTGHSSPLLNRALNRCAECSATACMAIELHYGCCPHAAGTEEHRRWTAMMSARCCAVQNVTVVQPNPRSVAGQVSGPGL